MDNEQAADFSGSLQPPSDRVRKLEHALDGIYEISRVLTSPVSVEGAMAAVASCLVNYLALQHILIVLFQDDGTVRLAVGHNWDERATRNYQEKVAKPIISRIVATRMPVLIPDAAHEPLFEDLTPGPQGLPRAFLGIPIQDRDRLFGVIVAEQVTTVADTAAVFDAEINFLIMVANLVGQMIRLQRFIAKDRDRGVEPTPAVPAPVSTPTGKPGIGGIIGRSSVIQEVLRKINIVAKSHLPVLLRGESGTGKELFAQAIHDLSPRRTAPMVKVNCAALPESMLESELFGHEKGAFTGALAMRKGRFELADGGTLFLDEIGEISPAFQSKLLRVLQQGEFERVGGIVTIKVDVRLVAATNRNLEEAVTKGEFRADLYFRICVIPIVLPPLRERTEDIPALAREFLSRFNIQHGTSLAFTEEGMGVLQHCSFPGNIRELESCVSRTAAFVQDDQITADDFACQNEGCISSKLWHGKQAPVAGGDQVIPALAGRPGAAPMPAVAADPVDGGRPADPPAITVPVDSQGDEEEEEYDGQDTPGGSLLEYQRLVDAMNRAGWVQAKAARLLGLSSRQLSYALRKHGIEVKKF